MNDTLSVKSSVVIDKSVNIPANDGSIYEMSEIFERDARRYNRAFLEEEEVAVR